MMDTIPLEIASHINTDKKWLEENLLCLVSNAVKFQMEGTVTVRCTIACQTDTQRTDTENYHGSIHCTVTSVVSKHILSCVMYS